MARLAYAPPTPNPSPRWGRGTLSFTSPNVGRPASAAKQARAGWGDGLKTMPEGIQ